MAGESDGLKMKPLYEKLWKILKAVERIEKDKHNQQGGYKYASESAIKEALHPLFAEHGLVLRPADMDQVSFTPPSGDKKSYITTLKIRLELIDLESGEFMPLVILASSGVKPWHKYQIAAYAATQKVGDTWPDGLILQLKSNGKFKEHRYPASEMEWNFKVFEACHTLWLAKAMDSK